jgi:hypothetical protein
VSKKIPERRTGSMRASAEVVIGRLIDEVFPHAIGLRESGPRATTSPAPIQFVVKVNEPPTRHVVTYTSGPSSFEILTQLEPVGAATKVTHTVEMRSTSLVRTGSA